MKVSVIIPTYNYGRFIKECIDSVFAQTFQDFEILVIDDGSTDNTGEIIGTIEDARLKYIKIPNSGVSVARNKGIDTAQGENIAFLDADDKWLPEKLELQVKILDEYPDIGLVFTNFSRFDSNGVYDMTLFDYIPEFETINKAPILDGRGYQIIGDTFNTLSKFNMSPAWVPTCLFRSDKIGSIRFPVGVRLSEDFNFMLRIYEDLVAAYLPEPLLLVRRHDSNSYSRPEQMFKPDIIALYDVLGKLKKPEHRKSLKNKMSHKWASLAYYHYWHGSILYATYAYFRVLFLPGLKLNAIAHIVAAPFQLLNRKINPKS
jgi:glycosyltransferase involved in cell wall biosynthesis